MVNYKRKALDLEKKAREARYAQRTPLYDKITSRFYEQAGDAWFKQAIENEPRVPDIKRILGYALHNYEKAEKIILSEKEKERIMKKRNTIESKIDKLSPRKGLGERITIGLFSIISLSLALVSISFEMTGNVIGGISSDNLRWVGFVLFIAGLTFAFFYLRKKK